MKERNMEHSREPWREGAANSIVSDDAAGPMVNGAEMVQHYGGYMVAESVAPENRRRIVACVNACAGVPTELLEAYPAPFSEMRAQRDQLLAALEEIDTYLDNAPTVRGIARAAIAAAKGETP